MTEPACCAVLQSIVSYCERMKAAGKTPVIEPPLHQQQSSATAAMDVDDSDDEQR